jgi:hypothetical protein
VGGDRGVLGARADPPGPGLLLHPKSNEKKPEENPVASPTPPHPYLGFTLQSINAFVLTFSFFLIRIYSLYKGDSL